MSPFRTDEEKGALLPRLSLQRPVTVFVIACAILLVGVVALARLPIQLMPSGFDPAFLMVMVPYPGGNPTETEQTILLPLEDALYTVGNLKSVRCRAMPDGVRCWVEFQNSVDIEEIYNEVADRVERLRATTWPDDIERVHLRRFNPESRPILNVAVTLPEDLEDPYWVAWHRIAQPLERVAGVAQVDLEGLREKEIFIEPDRDAMQSHGLSMRDLRMSLDRANFALASGDVRDGGRKLLVRSVARFTSLEQIRRLPIRADGLRLQQVAAVRYDHPKRDRVSRLDGREAVIFEIFKESEANTVAVTTAVRDATRELFEEDRALAGGSYEFLFDQGEVILGSMQQLRNTGLLGGMFAVIVLYVFLRRFRVTLLVTLAIPASLLGCLVIMYFTGSSINVISMLGMLICTGMLVDNAVVVVENIDRFRRAGEPVRKAALVGSSEIALALTMATTTTIAVFLPIVLLSEEGMMRFMLTNLSLPVVFALLTSLIVALFFVPVAAAWLLRDANAIARKPRRRLSLERVTELFYGLIFERLHRLYMATLRWSLDHRAISIVVVLATLAVTWYPFTQVEWDMRDQHQGGGRTARFWFNLPNSYSIDEADQWFRQVESAFESRREEAGIRHLQTRFWNNRGMVRAILEDVDKSDVSVDEAIRILQAAAPQAPGVKMYVNWQRGSGEDASLNVTLYGEDTQTLAELSEEAERRLRSLPELISAEPDLEAAQEEVLIRVDRERALRYGVPTEAVSGTVAAALRGQRLPRFRTGEKEIEIRFQFPEEDRQGIGKLGALQLRAAGGKRIPLEAIADVSVDRGYGDIQRQDRRTSLSIKLNTTYEDIGKLRGQVTEVMNGMNLPQGYSWDFGSSFRWERENQGNMMLGLLLSFVFIYLIMGFLFESFLLPLSVMPSIALSWIGVYWLLWITDTSIDMMGGIGLILLAGVVVNNGIVLVDLINRLRMAGYSRLDATLEAGKQRFRPILMTATTTIMGMLPLAFSNATFVGMPYESLGKVFVGGLLSSTTLTLVIVPLFYNLLDDARGLLQLLFTGLRPAGAGAGLVVSIVCLAPMTTSEAVTPPAPTATGVVFADRDGDGIRDAGEEGLPGVAVSNGRRIVTTDEAGRFAIPVPGEVSGQTAQPFVFVIKPRGYRWPVDELEVPRFYASLERSRDDLSFPLVPTEEPDRLDVLLLGDPQVRDVTDLAYHAQDVVDPLADVDADFGFVLGDLVYDNLDLFAPLGTLMSRVGFPWVYVHGNHDMDYDATSDAASTRIWEAAFGPATWAFEWGPAHFVVLDDVLYGGDPRSQDYAAGLREDQLAFLEADLARIPPDRLVVIAMHIPLDDFDDAQRQAFLSRLAGHENVLVVTAHWHIQRNSWLERDGRPPVHHLVQATACGSWWLGAPDEYGIPHTTMRDGAPNGYSLLRIDSSGYVIDFVPLGRPPEEQMHVTLPPLLTEEQAGGHEVWVNVYAGSPRSTVDFRLDGGPWQPARLTSGVVAPRYRAILDRERALDHARRRLPDAVPCPHLWKASLPRAVEAGSHRLEVRSIDHFGREHRAVRTFLVSAQ